MAASARSPRGDRDAASWSGHRTRATAPGTRAGRRRRPRHTAPTNQSTARPGKEPPSARGPLHPRSAERPAGHVARELRGAVGARRRARGAAPEPGPWRRGDDRRRPGTERAARGGLPRGDPGGEPCGAGSCEPGIPAVGSRVARSHRGAVGRAGPAEPGLLVGRVPPVLPVPRGTAHRGGAGRDRGAHRRRGALPVPTCRPGSVRGGNGARTRDRCDCRAARELRVPRTVRGHPPPRARDPRSRIHAS